MPAPSIILPHGFVLITDSSSYLGIGSQDNKTMFGIIQKVYTTSGYLVAGLSVSFDPTKATKFIYGSTIYFQVHEDFVTGNEGTPPP